MKICKKSDIIGSLFKILFKFLCCDVICLIEAAKNTEMSNYVWLTGIGNVWFSGINNIFGYWDVTPRGPGGRAPSKLRICAEGTGSRLVLYILV